MKPVLTAKWSEPVLQEGYIAFPKKLLRAASRIFQGDHGVELLVVALALVDYMRPDLKRPPSVGFLAFNAGMEPDLFYERARELAASGLISLMGNRDALRFDLQGLHRAIIENSDEA